MRNLGGSDQKNKMEPCNVVMTSAAYGSPTEKRVTFGLNQYTRQVQPHKEIEAKEQDLRVLEEKRD